MASNTKEHDEDLLLGNRERLDKGIHLLLFAAHELFQESEIQSV